MPQVGSVPGQPAQPGEESEHTRHHGCEQHGVHGPAHRRAPPTSLLRRRPASMRIRRGCRALLSRHTNRRFPRLSWLARDLELVVDVDDAARHPGGTDRRVVLGPRADVPG